MRGLFDADKFYRQTSLYYGDWGEDALAVNDQLGTDPVSEDQFEPLGWTFRIENPEAKRKFWRLYNITLNFDGTLGLRSYEKNIPAWAYDQIAEKFNKVAEALIDNGFGK